MSDADGITILGRSIVYLFQSEPTKTSCEEIHTEKSSSDIVFTAIDFSTFTTSFILPALTGKYTNIDNKVILTKQQTKRFMKNTPILN